MSQERLTAESIMEIYQDLGYAGVGVGPSDMAAGIDFLRESIKGKFPWISANILDHNGKPLFQQWREKTVGDIEIVITALTATPQNVSTDIQVLSADKILPDILAQIHTKKKPPFIILLSTLSHDENRRIAEHYPDINLIIGADTHKENISPLLLNNTLITQTGRQGKYQGLLEIIFGNQRHWGTDSNKQLADLQNKRGSLNWQLRRLEKKAKNAESDEKYKSTLNRLKKNKEELGREIDSAKERIVQEKTAGASKDHYTHRFIGLKKNMPDDQPTAEKIKTLNQDIRTLHKKAKKAAAQKRSGAAASPELNMVGFPVCEACHPDQADFWQSTGHADTYATLSKKKKQLDLDCLPCHVTLDLQSSTFTMEPKERLLSFPEEFLSVGCETCHGAGKKHSLNPETYKLVRLPGKNTCLTCHTPDHDDNFDYNTKLPQISCPAG